MPAKASEKETVIDVRETRTQTIDVALIGRSPLILNRLSQKAARVLLLPSGKMNAAERATNLKHDPVAEFRASPYTIADESAPTYLALMSSAVKGAMMTAALDLPGTKK